MVIEKSAPTTDSLQQHAQAVQLVEDMHAHDGLAPVDLERFWADQDAASDDPFGAGIRQVALGALPTWECVFDELGVEEDHWRFLNDTEWATGLVDAYNDKAERVLGRRILRRPHRPPAADRFPQPRMLHDLFEAENTWRHGSWWLQKSANGEEELARLLDRVNTKLDNPRSAILPPQWDERKADLLARGITPPLYRHQRGPVTFAASVYGSEDLLYLIMLNPELAARFRDTILRAMRALHRVLNEEAGYSETDFPRGFSFADDNCCLLNPDMYEFFGYPILKGIFDHCSPDPDDWRYQHSDSAMGHLLPILSRLNLSSVNFGPTLTVGEIRAQMPRTIIQGQLAPFTLSRNEEVHIVEEFLRDVEQAKEQRGLSFATAGSINNGSRLSSFRLIMAAIQRHGRYH